MKEIIEAIGNRVRSPVFGYFVLAFIVINWRALLLLWLADTDIETRIDYFCLYSDYLTLLIYPLVISTIGAVAYPWVNLLFLRLAHKPAIYKNDLQLNTDHERLVQQTKLEVVRDEMFAKKEEGLIEQAKRDQEILNIENEELRKKLESEIEVLRSERNNLAHGQSPNKSTTDNEKHVKDLIDLYQARAKEAKESYDHDKAEMYWKKAEDLQIRLAEKALGPKPKQ
ncbi:MAG: hypothetical protein JAZ19_12085 [Candidatus Thiodiazotropha taylori]|nr:hypothetical protein [Candidatus Thiodiazotropha taylori]